MAIQLYGPFYILPGSGIQQVNVNSQCGGIMVFNRSLYSDMFVSLSSEPPVTVPSAGPGGTGSATYATSDINRWHIYAPAGHVASLPIPNAKSYGILNPYTIGPNSNGTGTIFYAAVSYYQTNNGPPQGVSGDVLAPTGYSDFGYSQIMFLTWGVNDVPPSIAATSLATELTGQPRAVALPVSPAYGVAQDVTLVLNTWANVGTAVNIGNFPFTLTNKAAGLNGSVTIGLYSFSVGAFFSAVTFQQQKTQFRFVILDNASAIVSSLGFTNGFQSDTTVQEVSLGSTATSMYTASFQQPLVVPLTVAIGAGPPYTIQPQVITTFTTGGPFPVTVNATYDIAGFFPPTPGSFAGPGGTLSHIAYNEYIGFSY